MGAGHHLAAGHPRRTARTGVLGTAGRAIGGHLAVAPAPVRGTAEARRRLNAACQWLWVLGWAVQAAHERDPVTAADLRLLHAIPLHALARRHLPDGTEPVTRLCQGTIDTAERVRRHARAAISRASWSPDLTMESLRETAACATIISHNCQVLLDTLTRPAGQHPEPGLTASLAAAADAAGNARRAWLYAARGWDLITTDTRGTLSPAAAETADLALWTGRLAYADPAWTPDLGPSRTVRPAAQLTELPAVIAAVHHACETLTQVAAADHAQLTAAARTGRLLVPTRSLPEEFDIPHRFAPAPAARTQPLLTAYHDARTASAQATASTAVVAETVRSPSRILTTARAAVASNSPPGPRPARPCRAHPARPRRNQHRHAAAGHRDRPGRRTAHPPHRTPARPPRASRHPGPEQIRRNRRGHQPHPHLRPPRHGRHPLRARTCPPAQPEEIEMEP